MVRLSLISVMLVTLSCKSGNEPANVESPGEEKSTKTKVLEVGSALLQFKKPINQLEIYLDGFHFANGDFSMQSEAHHYCHKINEDITQCIMYDGNTDDARLIGIEYIISEKLFKTLPEEERKLWHSHVYEVKSGQLIAPGLPDIAEKELMEEIISTYGKTYHTWHTNRGDKLPVGMPLLMMGFTNADQIKDSLLIARDKAFNISFSEKRAQRKDLPSPVIQPGANAWEKGEIYQLEIQKK